MNKLFLLLLIIIFHMNILAQVVIKDEIVLDEKNIYETGIESTGLTTTFYGKVKETILTGTIVCHISRTTLIVNGAEYPFGPCLTWNCAPYPASCFCVAGNPATERTNIPAYTNVGTRFLKCKNVNGQYVWVELEHYYEEETTNENYKKYKIYSRLDASSDWQHVGWMEFNKTTPPECAYAQNCSTGYMVTMPDTLSVKQPFSFTTEDECSTYIDSEDNLVIPIAAFGGVTEASKSSNLFNLSPENDIEVCFDLQTQKLKFNLLVENTTLNYVKDICWDNVLNAPVNSTPIYNLSSICQLSPAECSDLKKSLQAHTEYPPTSDFFNRYFFVEIALTHETEHQKDWEGYIGKYVNNYFNIPQKINYGCQDFISEQQAKEEILFDIKNLFASDFWNPYKTDWMTNEYLWPTDPGTLKKKRAKEKILHKRPSIKQIIKEYEDEIKKLCGGNCP